MAEAGRAFVRDNNSLARIGTAVRQAVAEMAARRP